MALRTYEENAIGALVREYRLKAGLSQLELARKLKYPNPNFISIFERGMSKVPLKTLGQLVEILGIPEKKVMKVLLDSYEKHVSEELEKGKNKLG